MATICAMTTDAYVGKQIHGLMWDRRITNRAMAQAIGVDESTMARKLRGQRKWTVDDLLAVAGELHVPVEALLPHLDSNQEPAGFQSARDALVLAA